MVENIQALRVKRLLTFQASKNLRATDICKAADINRGLFSRYINNDKLTDRQARKIEEAYNLPTGYFDGLAKSSEIEIPVYHWGDYTLTKRVGIIYEYIGKDGFAIIANKDAAKGIIDEGDYFVFEKASLSVFINLPQRTGKYLIYIHDIEQMTICRWSQSFESIYSGHLFEIDNVTIIGKFKNLRSKDV